jgi:hypothetical protein
VFVWPVFVGEYTDYGPPAPAIGLAERISRTFEMGQTEKNSTSKCLPGYSP